MLSLACSYTQGFIKILFSEESSELLRRNGTLRAQSNIETMKIYEHRIWSQEQVAELCVKEDWKRILLKSHNRQWGKLAQRCLPDEL